MKIFEDVRCKKSHFDLKTHERARQASNLGRKVHHDIVHISIDEVNAQTR